MPTVTAFAVDKPSAQGGAHPGPKPLLAGSLDLAIPSRIMHDFNSIPANQCGRNTSTRGAAALSGDESSNIAGDGWGGNRRGHIRENRRLTAVGRSSPFGTREGSR